MKTGAGRGDAACSSALHSWQSVVGRIGISSGLNFLKSWGCTVGQQGGWKSMRV